MVLRTVAVDASNDTEKKQKEKNMSNKNNVMVTIGLPLAAIVATVKDSCGQKGDSSQPERWFRPETPVALRLCDGEGGEGIAYVEGVRSARGGPNSEGAGSTLLVRMISGETVYGEAIVSAAEGSTFALHSKDSAQCEQIEVLSLADTVSAVLAVAGVRPLDLGSPELSVSRLLGITPKQKPEPKPLRAPRTARVVAAAAAPSRFSGGKATDLSDSPALDALEAATDSAQG